MKLPEGIVGKNKIRDMAICKDYIDGLLPKEIVLKYARTHKISLRRVQQILYENRDFVFKHLGWDKTKRLHVLQRLAEKEIQSGSLLKPNKDILDILEQIRIEVDGSKGGIKVKIDNSNHTTNVYSIADRMKNARERVYKMKTSDINEQT